MPTARCRRSSVTSAEEVDEVNDRKSHSHDMVTWAIGGGVILGLGVGLFFLQQSALAFVGSLLGGLGIGLIISAVLSVFGRARDSGEP